MWAPQGWALLRVCVSASPHAGPGQLAQARPLSVAHQLYSGPRSLAALLTSRGATHRMAP